MKMLAESEVHVVPPRTMTAGFGVATSPICSVEPPTKTPRVDGEICTGVPETMMAGPPVVVVWLSNTNLSIPIRSQLGILWQILKGTGSFKSA